VTTPAAGVLAPRFVDVASATRATFDLSLATRSEAQEAPVRAQEELGYDTVHRLAGYSNHSHPDPDFKDLAEEPSPGQAPAAASTPPAAPPTTSSR
jgi:hypothetical protein